MVVVPVPVPVFIVRLILPSLVAISGSLVRTFGCFFEVVCLSFVRLCFFSRSCPEPSSDLLEFGEWNTPIASLGEGRTVVCIDSIGTWSDGDVLGPGLPIQLSMLALVSNLEPLRFATGCGFPSEVYVKDSDVSHGKRVKFQ